MAFIPNDYTLRPGDSHFTLLTGPNMGGKSTYIRALGCVAVMAQARKGGGKEGSFRYLFFVCLSFGGWGVLFVGG